MITSTSYANRLIDIELLQTITEPTGSKAVSVSIAKSTPKIVTGIQKLVQRYANLFLTSLNDVEFAKDIGTDFIRAVVSGSISNFGRFFEVFAIANARTTNQLLLESEGLPDDEIIDSAELIDFDVNTTNGSVMLRIKITSVAGDEVEYVIPTATLKG